MMDADSSEASGNWTQISVYSAAVLIGTILFHVFRAIHCIMMVCCVNIWWVGIGGFYYE